MIVVNPKSVHLLKGYLLASEAENHLQNRWRTKLQTALAKRKKKYETAVSQHEQHKHATNRDILTGVMYVLAGIGISAVCFLVPLLFHTFDSFWKIVGTITLALTSMLGTGLGVFWLIQLTLPKPQPPDNPFQSTLFTPILAQWKTALKTSLPPAIQAGDVGEHTFIHNLQLMLGNDYFLLSGIQQRYGEDVDVVLIGPKGVWVFEVKYWSGTIRWRSGQWLRTKTYYAPGGVPVTEQKAISQPPDKQWQRVAADVSKSIQIQCPDLVARYLGGIAIKGGLVFTHKEANYEMGPGFPISWGYSQWWLGHFLGAPKVPHWREADSMKILDALLTRHREIDPHPGTKCMMDQATRLIAKSDQIIANWVKKS